MRFLHYLKYLFIVVSITIFVLYIVDNENISKPILVTGYILIFFVPILNKFQKQRISNSREKNKLK